MTPLTLHLQTLHAGRDRQLPVGAAPVQHQHQPPVRRDQGLHGPPGPGGGSHGNLQLLLHQGRRHGHSDHPHPHIT